MLPTLSTRWSAAMSEVLPASSPCRHGVRRKDLLARQMSPPYSGLGCGGRAGDRCVPLTEGCEALLVLRHPFSVRCFAASGLRPIGSSICASEPVAERTSLIDCFGARWKPIADELLRGIADDEAEGNLCPIAHCGAIARW